MLAFVSMSIPTTTNYFYPMWKILSKGTVRVGRKFERNIVDQIQVLC